MESLPVVAVDIAGSQRHHGSDYIFEGPDRIDVEIQQDLAAQLEFSSSRDREEFLLFPARHGDVVRR